MKPEIRYGIYSGIGVSLWVIVEYLLGFHTRYIGIGQYSGYFASIIPIVFIYLALRERRQLWHHGSLTFWQGVKYGFVLALVSALIITAFFWLYNHYINPGWLDAAREYQRNKMIQAGASSAEISRKLQELQKYSTPMFEIIWNLVGTTALGLFFAIIISFFMKKKPVGGAEV